MRVIAVLLMFVQIAYADSSECKRQRAILVAEARQAQDREACDLLARAAPRCDGDDDDAPLACTQRSPLGQPPTRITKLAGAGVLAATSGLVLGAYLGGLKDCGGFCAANQAIGGEMLGAMIGVTVGASIAVVAVGHTNDETGSTLATFGGSIAGLQIGLGVSVIAILAGSGLRPGSPGADIAAGVALTAVVVGPVVGAVGAFESSRRYVPTFAVEHGGATVGVAGRF